MATRYKQETTAIIYKELIIQSCFLNHYNYAYNLSILMNGDRDERARVQVHQRWSGENLHVINQALIIH